MSAPPLLTPGSQAHPTVYSTEADPACLQGDRATQQLSWDEAPLPHTALFRVKGEENRLGTGERIKPRAVLGKNKPRDGDWAAPDA